MVTAEEIATITGIKVHTVRYRLGLLRAVGQVKAKQFGTTYVYPESAIKKVETYNE